MSTQVGESAWANTWREVEDRIRTDAATMWAVAGTPKRADVEQIARKHQVPFRVVWAAAVALMNGSPIRRPPQPDDWPIARIAADLPPAPKVWTTCEECGRGFGTPQGISLHRTRAHRKQQQPSDSGEVGVSSTPTPVAGTDVAEVTPSPAPEPAAQAEPGCSAVAPSAGDGGPPSPPSPAAGPSDEEEPESAALGKMLDPITCYLGSDQPVEVQQAAEAATAAIRRLHDTVLAHDRRAQLQARRAQLAAELAAIDAQLSEQVAA